MTLWKLIQPHHSNTFRLSTERCIRRALTQSVYVIAIRKIACVEDDHLEKDVRSASSGMNTTDGHEALQGPSVGMSQLSCDTA
jgi:hypothetical protein